MSGEEKRDELAELMRSPAYALVVSRINEAIELKRGELETTPVFDGGIHLGRVQGYLAGLRLALNIPEILRDEAKSKL